MSAPTWTPRLVRLWPTLVNRCRLASHAEHDPGLIALVESMDADAEQMTTDYRTVDILALDHDDIRWLNAGIDAAVRTYFGAVGLDYEIRWQARGWANVNRRGDYHSPHNHAWSYLSGTYYVRVPSQPGREPGSAPPDLWLLLRSRRRPSTWRRSLPT